MPRSLADGRAAPRCGCRPRSSTRPSTRVRWSSRWGGVDISWVVGGVAGFVLYMIAMSIPIGGQTALGRPTEPELEPAPGAKIASP